MPKIRLTMTEEQLGVLIGALNVCQKSIGLDATAQMADLMKVIENKEVVEDLAAGVGETPAAADLDRSGEQIAA